MWCMTEPEWLDIGCWFGSFGAHLFSLKLMTTCIAEYEDSAHSVIELNMVVRCFESCFDFKGCLT